MTTQRNVRAAFSLADRVEAERIVRHEGGRLLSNKSLGRLVRGMGWSEFGEPLQAFAREIVVHPHSGGKFVRGCDVSDRVTKLGIRAADIPEEAIGKEAVQLCIVPKGFEKSRRGHIVVPKSIVLVHPAVENGGGHGRIHGATGLILAKPGVPDGHIQLSKNASVSPIVRGNAFGGFDFFEGRLICADGSIPMASVLLRLGRTLAERARQITAASLDVVHQQMRAAGLAVEYRPQR